MKTIFVLDSRDFGEHIGRREQIFKLLSKHYKVFVFGRMINVAYYHQDFRKLGLRLFSFRVSRVSPTLIYIGLPQIFLPFNLNFRIINKLNGLLMKVLIILIKLRFKIGRVDLWWLAYPYGIDAVPRKGTVVYDCFDNHLAWGGFHSVRIIREIEINALKRSSISFFSSSDLLRSREEYAQRSKLILNGADYNHFIPRSLNTNSNIKIVLYIGVISNWVDFKIVNSLPALANNLEFWFIGPVRNKYLDKIRHFKNVKIFGPCDYAELPSYLEQASCCIIPFDISNPLIKSTSPIKLYEYFASGKPVVSTSMDEVLKYPNDVYFADEPDEFAQKINVAIKEDSPARALSRQQIAKENSWESRVSCIEKELSNFL